MVRLYLLGRKWNSRLLAEAIAFSLEASPKFDTRFTCNVMACFNLGVAIAF
jgi:hypothetical protein